MGVLNHAARMLVVYLARHWLITLITSLLAVFFMSYFYFTATHALESFDSGSCTPLALTAPDQSKSCVSSLQSLLDDDQTYPVVAVDGYFGGETQRAVMIFQSAHHLTADGIVAGKTASAINDSSPRPRMLSYAAGFVNSKLALTAKLTVAALMTAATIGCLLLRGGRDNSSSTRRFRLPLAGLFAGFSTASSAAADTLLAESQGWMDKILCIILIGLASMFVVLVAEMFDLSAFVRTPLLAPAPRIEDDYGR